MEKQKKEILRMLESGVITTDEALKLLEAMNDAEKIENPKEEATEQSLSTRVLFDDEEEEKKVYHEQSTVGKVSGFIQNALNKLSKMDFNFTSSVDFTHIFSFPAADVMGMNIDLFNGSVNIVPHQQDEVRVECKVKVYKQKDLEEARKIFLDEVRADVKDRVLRVGSSYKWLKLDTVVYVPKHTYDVARVRLFNGSIRIEELSFGKIVGKTANGSVYLNKIIADDCDMETANGKIEMIQSEGKKCELETVNGKIDVQGAFESVEAESVTSGITVTVTKPLESKVSLKSATGNIECLVPRGIKVNGKLETNFGGFTCDLEAFEVLTEQREKLQKEMKFQTNREHLTAITLEAESKAGSIFVKHND